MPSLDFNVDKDDVLKQIDEHLPVDEKDVPTEKLFVCREVPLTGFPEDEGRTRHEVVGTIDYPTSFCPGADCEAGRHSKDPLRYWHKKDTNFWVHDACGLPTKAWWEGHYGDVVTSFERQK